MSNVLQITGKGEGGKGVPTTVSVNTGETAEESIKMFGGDAVNSNANANWTITIRAGVNRHKKAGKSDAEIQQIFKGAKMGVAVARVSDPTSAILAAWPNKTEEERAAFLKSLKEASLKK